MSDNERKSKLPSVRVRSRGADIQESVLSGHADLDEAAEIIRKRLEGNPFSVGGSLEIRLKDPTLECRWFNAEKNPDHIWRAKNVLGWTPVREDMVADLEQLGGYNLVNGIHVARGERSREVLMCMPKDARKQIHMAKTQANDRSFGSSKRTKADLVQAAAVQLGDEAASFIDGQVFGEVTDSIERTPLEHDIPER